MLPSVFCKLYWLIWILFHHYPLQSTIFDSSQAERGRPKADRAKRLEFFFVTFSYFWSTFLILSVILGRNCFHTVLYSRASKRVKAEAVSEEAVAGSVAAASKANAPRAAASNNQGRSLSSFWWEQEEQFWQEEKEKKAWKKFLLTLSKLTYTTGPMGQFFIADERIVKMVLNNSIYMRFAL